MNLQPQRVPLGSFTTPQGQEIQVYISQPWFRSLVAVAQAAGASSTTPVTPTDGAPLDGPYVMASDGASTPNSRVLSVDQTLDLSDGGPGGNLILGISASLLSTLLNAAVEIAFYAQDGAVFQADDGAILVAGAT